MRRGQRRIHQFKQAILTQAQAAVEFISEVAEPLPSIGLQHTIELGTVRSKPEDPPTPWARSLSKVRLISRFSVRVRGGLTSYLESRLFGQTGLTFWLQPADAFRQSGRLSGPG